LGNPFSRRYNKKEPVRKEVRIICRIYLLRRLAMKIFQPQEIIHALQTVLNIDQRASGLNYLQKIAQNIAQTFECKYILIGHAIKPENSSVQTDVVWADKDYGENFTYELKGTPCENVLSGNRVCIYPKDVVTLFPQDTLLKEMNCESYVGAPMLTRDGQLSGLMVLLDDKPIKERNFSASIVEFLAMRVGAELDRYYMEEHLKRQVIERTTELEQINHELETALSEIRTLRGIIPICSSCKKVRDDKGYWQQVEAYITQHSEATFSHGICPQCMEKYYQELDTHKQ